MTFWDWANNHEIITLFIALAMFSSLNYVAYVIGTVRAGRRPEAKK